MQVQHFISPRFHLFELHRNCCIALNLYSESFLYTDYIVSIILYLVILFSGGPDMCKGVLQFISPFS